MKIGVSADQSVPPDTLEVVVVDDGSGDGTFEWLRTLRQPFALRVFRQANQGPAAARNRGIEAAHGAIVLFLDDDVVAAPHLIREHLESHSAEDGIAVMGPLALPPGHHRPWVAWHQMTMERRYQAMTAGEVEPSFREFWTGNASIARRHALAAGGFEPSFRTGEDVEFGSRLLACGVRFRFNPAARGLHYSAQPFDAWRRRFTAWGEAEVRILRRLGEARSRELLTVVWRSLHPLTRLVVRGCSGRRYATATATRLLSGFIRLVGVPLPMSRVPLAACGCLANLLYWEGAARALARDGRAFEWPDSPRE